MNKQAKIVMTTMFKNESTVIRRMLESCYKYIDYYVIQNNGSTDGTQEVVEDFFKDKNIPGVVYNCEEGWKGFGWNRDHLIKYTQNVDHGCDWILKMDCDEILEVDDDFDWSPLNDQSIQSFHITAIMGNSIYYRAWMWNARLKWAFNHDPCHETIYVDDGVIGEQFIRYDLPKKIRQIGFPEGQSWANPLKFVSDALILEEKMIKENNMLNDLYHFWYIGKSYNDARFSSAFPLGESQQKEFARRSNYYFYEYLNITQDFANSKVGKGISEMAYMALVLVGENYKFLDDNQAAIEPLILAEQFSPARNEHLVALAGTYQNLEQFDKMLEVTNRLVDPSRLNPFPTYHMMVDNNCYVDTGELGLRLHYIALENKNLETAQPASVEPHEVSSSINTFMINKNSNKRLFVVDNFYADPDSVRNFALGVEFQEDLRFYKGMRSVQSYQPYGIIEAFESIIGQKITHFGEGSPNGCFQITTAQDPQVYHHDLQKWAAMIYLSPNAPLESGTRLMRTKNGQIGHMTDPRINEAFTGGFYDSTKFEIVDSASNVYNRLVIMDSQHIHSAGAYFGQGKEDGRLTHLFFFD
jgi:glycosyltransferase involved in cell wall biosynthesis